MITKNCLQCGKEFQCKDYLKDKTNFCSISCSKKGVTPWNKVGITKNCEYCGVEFGIKPRRLKTAKYCSNSCKDKARIGKPSTQRGVKFTQFSGENHWKWKGGISPQREKDRKTIEMREWRRGCLSRDNFTCQKTGQRGGDLQVHHINNFSEFIELRTSIENGITLSKKSHEDFHKKYGYKNNTKEQLQEYLNKLN